MNYCVTVVLFLLQLQSGAAKGSGADVPFRSFDHLSTQAGLVGAGVLAILEDRQGFMWFGTEQGLNRYDGYSFKNYERGATPDGLSATNIWGLMEDSDGTISLGLIEAPVTPVDAVSIWLTHGVCFQG